MLNFNSKIILVLLTILICSVGCLSIYLRLQKETDKLRQEIIELKKDQELIKEENDEWMF